MTAAIAVDSSALITVLNRESGMPRYLEALRGSHRVIGWPTVFEVRIWCLRRAGGLWQPWLEDWLNEGLTRVVAFNGVLERAAALAYERFGKGRHPAALNFGDCMSYAVAQHFHAPLLFKGDDFDKTDLKIHAASVAP